MSRAAWLGAVSAVIVTGLFSWVAADQVVGVDGAYWSGRVVATTSGLCVAEETDAGLGNCMLFPAGSGPDPSQYSVTTVVAHGLGHCGFAGTSSATLDDMNWDTSRYGAGGGNIHAFPAAGSRWDQRPDWITTLWAVPGGSQGLCDTAVTIGGDSLYVPCSSAGTPGASQCTTYSAGTCRTSRCTTGGTQTGCISDLMMARAGAFLICEGQDATVNFDVTKGRVRR